MGEPGVTEEGRKASPAAYVGRVLVVAVILCVVAGFVLSHVLRQRDYWPGSTAEASLKTLVTAEEQYKATAGGDCYATLSQLSAMTPPYVDTVLGAGKKSGYCFRLFLKRPANAGWYVTASPVTVGKTGNRFGYVDETGIIRFRVGGPAASADPAIE